MERTITKRILANRLARTLNIPIRKSITLINIFFSTLKSSLSKGEEITIPRLGKISVKKSPDSRRMWRLDKVVTQYKHKRRILFRADKSW